MKRIILILLLGLFALFPVFGHCAGSVTQTYTKIAPDTWLWQLDWVGDASDGSVPDTDSTIAFDHYVVLVVTNPDDDTAPDANYDIDLDDEDGIDVMGSTLDNRSDSASEHAVPKIGNCYGARWVHGLLTLQISGNSTASAEGTIKVFLQK